jgi:hypothetical protein
VAALKLHQATESHVLFQARIGGFDVIQTFLQLVWLPLSTGVDDNIEEF